MGSIIDILHDPGNVWRFQSFCGVEKVKSSANSVLSFTNNILIPPASEEEHCHNRLTKRVNFQKSDPVPSTKVSCGVEYRIRNWFLFYLFKFGSFLGDEEFYMVFFPFLFWNLDSLAVRKLSLIWAVSMYLGQSLKDILQWPRPESPPAVRLEKHYLTEFGMPSTHAIVAAAFPLSLAVFEAKFCQVPLLPVAILVLAWTSLVCISRVYNGVHTFLEVICGLALSYTVVALILPFSSRIDIFLVTQPLGVASLFIVATAAALAYPSLDGKWTPAYSDTVAILLSALAIHVGSFFATKIGVLKIVKECGFSTDRFLRAGTLCIMFGRLILGVALILLTRLVMKWTCYKAWGFILGVNAESLRKSSLDRLEFWTKFVCYFCMGLCIPLIAPVVFRFVDLSIYT